MRGKLQRSNAAAAALLAFLLLCGRTSAARAEDGIATLFSKEGTVEFQKPGERAWREAEVESRFAAADRVATRENSRAGVLYRDGVLVRLSENTELEFEAAGSSEKVEVSSGKAFFLARKTERFPTIETPVFTAAIRGTEFTIEATPSGAVIAVLEGAVVCENAHGSVTLGSGETASARPGEAPVKGVLVDSADAVDWVLFYPEINIPSSEPALDRAARELRAGDVASARRLVESADRSPAALALRAVIEVTLNRSVEATQLAESALEADPESVPALLAASFAAQSRFDLDAALRYTERALALAAGSPDIAARRAELLLAFDRREDAGRAVEEALAADPDDPRALTVLGFIELLEYEPARAAEIFERAAALAPGYGLPRVGRGLALVRLGALDEGRRLLEEAVLLEPVVSVYRSYLGKAYFEEEREDAADREYERAINLDPQDPTPYLYRAFSRLSQNRPVGALADVEASIDRNDNRAVYRSSLLLDRDAAVRSASLAEVFRALGFERAAQVEAIKSISRDYGNFSAHRLLSESYRTVFLNDAALSERRIAELTAPLNFNLFRSPVGGVTFNEYSALLERSQTRVALGGSASTLEDALVGDLSVAGVTERAGLAFATEGAAGNGSKDGNSLRDYRFRLAGQYQFTPDDRFLLSGRYQYRRDEDFNATPDDSRFELDEFDFGYNRRLGPDTTLIALASLGRQRSKFHALDSRLVSLGLITLEEAEVLESEFIIDETDRERLEDFRTDVQLIHDSEYVSLVAGGQIYRGDSEQAEESEVLFEDTGLLTDLGTVLRSSADNDLESNDGYVYSIFHLGPWADLTAGLSRTHLVVEERTVTPYLDETRTLAEWTPKFGLTGYLGADTTVRGAYFESLRKSNLEDTATLEPTLVGGINQRLTDFPGARSRNYGFGIDHKLAASTYMGVEALHRDVVDIGSSAVQGFEFDFDTAGGTQFVTLAETFTQHADHEIGRAYLYQVFSDDLVGTLDYSYDDFEFTDPADPLGIETHKISAALRYFSPRRWFAFAAAAWREQDLDASFFFENGNRDFWIVDAGLGYRLPNRHGLVALEVLNVLDQGFQYDQSLGFEEFIAPDLSVRAVLRLDF